MFSLTALIPIMMILNIVAHTLMPTTVFGAAANQKTIAVKPCNPSPEPPLSWMACKSSFGCNAGANP